MLRREDFLMIQSRVKAGVYQKDVASELGVHPKTISRALRRGSAPRGARARGFVVASLGYSYATLAASPGTVNPPQDPPRYIYKAVFAPVGSPMTHPAGLRLCAKR